MPIQRQKWSGCFRYWASSLPRIMTVKQALRKRVDDDESFHLGVWWWLSIQPPPTTKKKAVYITELGVYNLIFRSSIVAAKQFKKWVTSRGITAKCLEYERHFEKMRKLYRKTLEIHERKVDAVEKFYIESMSDVAMKAIEDKLLWVFSDLQSYNHKLLLPFK